MSSVWYRPELADVIIHHGDIFTETHSIITDIVSGHLDIADLVQNMAGVLTNNEPENREKGMRFYTKILKELPRDYLNDMQVKFISKFYIDRLKDHHRVVPPVLEGYSVLIDMMEYNIQNCTDFLTVLFREVTCQSQTRQDRYNIYVIFQKLCNKDIDYMKSLGSDFVYGVISAMDGERDPRNLLFLFAFLQNFLKTVPLGHLAEEMFDVISCYYPIDFHPSQDDPASVTRDDLANALAPCLCAIPEFGDSCIILLIEKLDSELRLAKIDSLKLLVESCNTFTPQSYSPFLRALWSSISREMSHKTDDELKLIAHDALSALIGKMATTANTDMAFENFLKGILISAQTTIAEATTVAQFVKGAKVLLTAANASDQSCATITRAMVPATVAYYELKTAPKLQIASLDFIGDLYECAVNRGLLNEVRAQVDNVPHICLNAVSQTSKEYQMAGFKTLIRVQDCLGEELVVPFVEVLIYNVQHAQDNDLLSISVETIHVIARKFPELIMNLVVKGKCSIDTATQDKIVFQKRLNLLTNLASLDDFTKVIIEEMLKIITSNDPEALHVVEALSGSISMASVFTTEKVTQIESDHGLIDPVLSWLYKEISSSSPDALAHGYTLISNTIGSLPAEKQENILLKHTPKALEECSKDDIYFLIIECLYAPLRQTVYNSKFEEIMTVALGVALKSDKDVVRTKACVLIAHLLNKAEHGQKFELLYELLKTKLSTCNREDDKLCPRLITLYGWITKSLLMRGSEMFLFWLQKIVGILSTSQYSGMGAESIKLIMTEHPDYLNAKQHCRISLLYKQRMFETFSGLAEKLKTSIGPATRENYLLSWAYVLDKAPKVVLKNEASKVAPIVIDALEYENKDMLLVSLEVLGHFVQASPGTVSGSLQTILPRLVTLTRYMKSMDVRIKSLECLYDIANTFRTSALLPYKQDVLIDLAPSLDDKKRLVRSVAVRARSRWFLVGAPGEDKVN
ncbi:MMS19 nucleotide excision repair protein homolog [Helicoverpa zea]|uniref:MMS19 nucleotide excision repair protein homolog n=1 Tax=Helicoverpa zea TaxID=7113 RepID=UPI001F56495D|nr:MMS19 nucleotide excision repair protein homolog [Helicoverpa zea]